MSAADAKPDAKSGEKAGAESTSSKKRGAKKAGKRIFPVVFTLIVTAAFISVTAVVYSITKDTVRLNATIFLKRAVLSAAGLAVPMDSREVENLFTERVREIKDDSGNVKYYVVYEEDPSTVKSYVFVRNGAGLWGTITATVGFEKDLETYSGLDIIDQNETPGLGGRITEEWFKEQFRGKSGPLVTVPEGDRAGDNQFEAITGATYSTTAIRDLMNDASGHARETVQTQ